jgi:hypothetical protein
VSSTMREAQLPVPALEIQMLRLTYNLLDEARKVQLLDYAQELIEEQRAERDTAATA